MIMQHAGHKTWSYEFILKCAGVFGGLPKFSTLNNTAKSLILALHKIFYDSPAHPSTIFETNRGSGGSA